MAEDLGEKTEEATPKRLRDAREEGKVARSVDLTSALVLAGGSVVVWVCFGPMLDYLGRSVRSVLGEPGLRSVGETTWTDSVEVTAQAALLGLLPVVLVIWLVALLANILQVGFILAPKSITPKASKLNPLEGVKRVFGTQALVKAGLDSMKVLLVLLVVVVTVNGMHEQVMILPTLPMAAGVVAIGELLIRLALLVGLVLLLLGIIDFIWQKHRHRTGLKMTKQQVKDEFKQMDGDPQQKHRRLQFARQLAQQRIASSVPKADVIVTNPEHISVALQWDQATMNAPVVVAMGADHLAMRIRQLAMQHSIPILERKPLARALYARVQVGDEIPVDLYQAVSEVLSFVYRMNGRMPAQTG
ncbi:MAG: flagellar biosynthesis protein FlhB [Planctomycetota bacterium]|nr:flagellar biosynthesis protein FlhB [Planctomycetota bacterium]MED5507003.1 flagellar biosynthesis protein FlhB [Planctomycetota bacterium]